MSDLLVKLYDLPEARPPCEALRGQGIAIRPARAYEKRHVAEWVRSRFGDGWASECEVAFGSHPIGCFLATRDGRILGFACCDATFKGFFGPLGVAEEARGAGVGSALLLRALQALAEAGYAYAVIGGAEATEFYARAVGAVEIPGSSPGPYRDRLQRPDDGPG
ncbi:MAG: GNAT family N-acetyltransferase [Deltaproteobacteria bacterium]|nr:GNAT family N-acetyltransferase [Deltaproteobacteria bacterium]